MNGSEATAAGFGLERIGQIAVIAHDVERATAFYRDALGMRFLFAAPGPLAFFDCGGIRLMLGRREAGVRPPGLDPLLQRGRHPGRARGARRRAASASRGRRTRWRASPATTSGWPSSATRRTTSWG